MTLVDYDLAILIMPTMALGSGLGVLLNRNLSPFAVCFALTVVLSFTTITVCRKARELR